MKDLFLSWSENRSLMTAEALRDWLPLVFPSIDPWLSVADIDRGKGWIEQLAEQLQQQQIGVICVAFDNLDSPWLFFEAGAVSESTGGPFVYAYLLDIPTTNVLPGPSSQLEISGANQEDTKTFLQGINKALGGKGISPTEPDQQFATLWPQLEAKLANIPPVIGRRDGIEELRWLPLGQATKKSLANLRLAIRP
jgi:hypothetical protein